MGEAERASRVPSETEPRSRASLRAFARSVRAFAARGLQRSLPRRWLVALLARRAPRAATVEVTTACQLRCPLCPTHDRERGTRFLPAASFARLLEGAHRLRTVSFHILGDPALHPELYAFVRACRERGVHTGFSTNGLRLEQQVHEVLDSGLEFLQVAIDGVDEEGYGRYRVGGSLKAVTRGVRALLAERERRGLRTPFVQLQTIMFPYNEAREEEVVSFLESFGADDLRLKRPSYCAEGGGFALTEEAAAFLELAGPDRERLRWSRVGPGAGVRYRDRPVCPQLLRATVLSDGRVVACCMDSTGETAIGDLERATLAEIWRGPRRRGLLEAFLERRLELCEHCDLA